MPAHHTGGPWAILCFTKVHNDNNNKRY